MKAIATLLLVLVAFAAAEELEAPKKAACHPQCKWQCDDPTCPAVCHPVCARPKCEMQCQQTECAKCQVHCEKPQCSVRCPKDMCEKDNCPKCETVCAPAECHTTCVAPKANCAPLCEETACSWSCAKPTTCPRPKCQLQCEKPACDVKDKKKCCPCTGKNLSLAVARANAAGAPRTAVVPSLMEVMATMKAASELDSEAAPTCCPCA